MQLKVGLPDDVDDAVEAESFISYVLKLPIRNSHAGLRAI
jgi:hypothetical protein